MKKLFNFKFAVAILAAFLAFGTMDGLAQKRRPVIRKKTTVVKKTVVRPTVKLYTVKSGEKFRVRMNETINSKTARVGDKFTTNVTEPVYSTTGVIVIPTGSTVTGRVDAVKAAKKGGDPGQIASALSKSKCRTARAAPSTVR